MDGRLWNRGKSTISTAVQVIIYYLYQIFLSVSEKCTCKMQQECKMILFEQIHKTMLHVNYKENLMTGDKTLAGHAQFPTVFAVVAKAVVVFG